MTKEHMENICFAVGGHPSIDYRYLFLSIRSLAPNTTVIQVIE
jgi:hypothetical protein